MTKKLKDFVKKNIEPAKGKFGVDPMDPWSVKANLSESMLDQYLLSRGINPKFVSTQTKISHAKSSSFLKWKQNHQFEAIELTEADKADIISLDIPLMIRMLELAREDVKDDMELHRITERLISIRNKGTLTMDDYDFIAGIKKLKEEIEAMAEGRMKDIATNDSENKRLNKLTSLDRFRAGAAAREKKHSDTEKKSGGMTSAIDRLEKHLNKEEVVNESDDKYHQKKDLINLASIPGINLGRDDKPKSRLGGGKDVALQAPDKTKNKAVFNKFKDRVISRMKTEDVYQDPQAATQTVFDGGNNTDDCSCDRKRQLSKSARMIKALYKKHNMKEDMTDWEKEDKSVQSYGKKPKLAQPDEKTNFGENKPSARIVMSGGSTLTGETRDTVEIDPEMKKRPGPDQVGATGKKSSQQ